jgi:iron(III) transport system substrate-binding protein
MTLTRFLLLFFPFISAAFLFLGTHSNQQDSVWIYASIYKEVIAELDAALKETHPDITISWYQSGSENVAARLNAELASGGSKADLIMTSDPFWFEELKHEGHLLPYESPLGSLLPAHYRDPDFYFVINRIPVGVIAYETTSISRTDAPTNWEDLTLPRWKGKLCMPSPLESGTALTFISQLVRLKGWSYFAALKKNQLLSSGGNSAVIQKIETKERPIGIVLLENVLQAKKRGAPIEIVYPKDGVILVPSPIAILKTTKHLKKSQTVYDFFLSEEAQKIFLKANVYAPLLPAQAPEGARSFEEIQKTVFTWDATVLSDLEKEKFVTKKLFTEMILK